MNEQLTDFVCSHIQELYEGGNHEWLHHTLRDLFDGQWLQIRNVPMDYVNHYVQWALDYAPKYEPWRKVTIHIDAIGTNNYAISIQMDVFDA